MFKCERCGKVVRSEEEPAGGEAECPECGGPLSTLSVSPGSAGGAGTCPSCHEPLSEGAVLCVNCGIDLRTGRRVTTRKPARTKRLLPSVAIQLPWWARVFIPLTVVAATAWFLLIEPLGVRFRAHAAFEEVLNGSTANGLRALERLETNKRALFFRDRLQLLIGQARWLAELDKAERTGIPIRPREGEMAAIFSIGPGSGLAPTLEKAGVEAGAGRPPGMQGLSSRVNLGVVLAVSDRDDLKVRVNMIVRNNGVEPLTLKEDHFFMRASRWIVQEDSSIGDLAVGTWRFDQSRTVRPGSSEDVEGVVVPPGETYLDGKMGFFGALMKATMGRDQKEVSRVQFSLVYSDGVENDLCAFTEEPRRD